jgi:tRNA (mo5U34)-methyltransferase
VATSPSKPTDPRAAIAEVPLWYHTIEVAPGVTTPGWFDLRPIVDRMPWPDVRGKRCLDVGTWDGFLAFELERRGAAEVVAVDIGSHEDWDWPYRLAQRGPSAFEEVTGLEQGVGFRVAQELLGSSVEKQVCSVYDLDPETLGQFDVVTCGSLMLHLREPVRALERIRTVCRGFFLSAEEVDLPLTALQRRRPAARLDAVTELFQWWIPNTAGHRRMLESAGFDLVRSERPYAIAFGEGHTPRGNSFRGVATRAARRLLLGGEGVPTHAVLARV